MQALRSHQSRSSWKLVGVAASIVVAGIIAGVTFWPRPSLAQELRQIQQADAGSQSVVERNWNQGPDGKMELYNEFFRLNGRYKMTMKGVATQYFDGKRITNDFGTYATVENKPAKMWKTHASSLDQLLRLDGINSISVKYGVPTPIGVADQYLINWETAGRSGKIELLADPKTKRPLRQTGVGGNSIGFKYEWFYRPTAEADVAFRPAPGYPVYDLDAQRTEFLTLLNDAKGTAENPEIIAAYVDENGFAVVFTCGEDGFDPDGTPSPKIAGLTGKSGSFPWGTSDTNRQHAAVYRGKLITAHGLRLNAKVPQSGPVTVTVLTPNGLKALEAKTIPMRRAASLGSLFAPMNIPFFMDGNDLGQESKASG